MGPTKKMCAFFLKVENCSKTYFRNGDGRLLDHLFLNAMRRRICDYLSRERKKSVIDNSLENFINITNVKNKKSK